MNFCELFQPGASVHEKSLWISLRAIRIWLMRRSGCHPQAKKGANQLRPFWYNILFSFIPIIKRDLPVLLTGWNKFCLFCRKGDYIHTVSLFK